MVVPTGISHNDQRKTCFTLFTGKLGEKSIHVDGFLSFPPGCLLSVYFSLFDRVPHKQLSYT